MDLSQRTVGQRIARLVRDFEQRHTQHGREWWAVFLNEETIVIALHGSLSKAECTSMGSCVQVAQHLRRLFADTALVRSIKSASGMVVRDTIVEIAPATGGVVLLLTTDTAGTEFPPATGRPARRPGRVRPEGGSRRATKTTGCGIRG
ncbi:Na-translocating system protein MpsC family protein [Frigoriglobus tundricola]|uniref:Na-translocating system protein MpsC family protein n=1 Tax=Frigoriglobus tundricola TaxID=2774151 RepID=UPI00148ED892|nr:Na-translocating system protein MpsC family protein [Frigoriglobus tundricola]